MPQHGVVDGQIVALFEDVGRHNALDKLLGYLAQENYDTSLGFVVMTSRASYELIRNVLSSILACLLQFQRLPVWPFS